MSRHSKSRPAPGKSALVSSPSYFPASFWPVLLIVSVVLVYANSLHVPLAFDDKAAIVENPTIRQLWPLSGPLSPPTNGSNVTGRPLVNLTLAINYAIGGLSVTSYHVVNLAIHACAALALCGLARRTLESPVLRERFGAVATPLGGCIALVWAVHPLLTESVTSTIQRTESFVSMWYLLTLYAFARAAGAEESPNPATAARPAWSWRVLAVVGCALGMASKEVMVTAPVVMWFYDRTFFARSFGAAWRQRGGLHVALALTWLVLAVALLKMGASRGVAAGVGLGISVGDYVLTQFHAVALYLRLALWPSPLVFDYGTEVFRSVAQVWPEMCVVLTLVVVTLVSLWRWPVIGFLGVWFFGILAPSSSVVPLVTQTIAEHRVYLPLVAVVALALGALSHWLKSAGWVVAGMLALALAMATWARNRDYRSEIVLWQDTVAKVPRSVRAQSNLADVLIEAGRGAEALGPAQAAVRLQADYPEAQNNLGIALERSGRLADAVEPYRLALKARPNYAGAQANLGGALAKLGRFDEAIEHLKAGLQLAPNGPDVPVLRTNLGNVYLQTGRFDAAIEQYRISLKMQPGAAMVHFNLGAALAQRGNLPEAREEFETTLKLDPQNAAARRALDYLNR